MRILLADNRSKVRFALRALLEQRPELEIVGDAVDAEGLLAQVEVACPDLVLLDWRLPNTAAADLLLALRGVCPDLHVIVLSERPETRRAVLAAGADAFVSKADPPEQLLATIADCWRRRQAGPGGSGAGDLQRIMVEPKHEGGRSDDQHDRITSRNKPTVINENKGEKGEGI